MKLCDHSNEMPTSAEWDARKHGHTVCAVCGALVRLHPRRLDWRGRQHIRIAAHAADNAHRHDAEDGTP